MAATKNTGGPLGAIALRNQRQNFISLDLQPGSTGRQMVVYGHLLPRRHLGSVIQAALAQDFS